MCTVALKDKDEGVFFRADIEGLRALAVLPVVFFHAFPSLIPGGFVGVDIFFVISGYLITSLLLKRLHAGRFTIRDFYGARIRRIFPALFFMLIVSSLFAYLILTPLQLKEYARTLGATSLFVSNHELYRVADYFGGAAELKPLLHTWSLSVEEQFYIFFPILLSLLFFFARRFLIPTFLVLAVASLLASERLLITDPSASFYFAGSRAFELLIGAVVATSPSARSAHARVREAATGPGLVSIFIALLCFDSGTPFPGFSALLPSVGAALFIWGGSGGAGRSTWISAPFRTGPVRWVGHLSYPLYLWHWPVLVFATHLSFGEPGVVEKCAAVLLSLTMAWLSARFVEPPLRHVPSHDRRLFAFGLSGIAVFCTLALVALRSGGFEDRFGSPAMALFAAEQDSNPRRSECHAGRERLQPYADRCLFGPPNAPPSIVVWGDSHGAELATSLGKVTGPINQSVAEITSSSCPPALGYVRRNRPLCVKHNEQTVLALSSDKTVHTVIMVARYSTYLKEEGEFLENGLRTSIEALSSSGKKIILIEPFPEFDYPVPAALGRIVEGGGDPVGLFRSREAYEKDNQSALPMLRRLANSHKGVLLFDTWRTLCINGRCDAIRNGSPLYFDDNHLSLAGATLIASDLMALLK